MLNKLVFWLAADCRPFLLVEDPSFREFCAALNPAFPIPTRQTVARRTATLYNQALAAVRMRLEDAAAWSVGPAITCDGWTGANQEGFISLTLHFVPIDCAAVESISLGVMHLPPPHTAVAYADKIREGLQLLGWNGAGELSLTTDSTTVMPATARELAFEWMPCCCHILHNAAKQGLDRIMELSGDGERILKLVEQMPTTLRQSNV